MTKVLFFAAVFSLLFTMQASAQAPATADSYTQVITKRADKIVAGLEIADREDGPPNCMRQKPQV